MEKVEKGRCMISMHSPHFPDGKITYGGKRVCERQTTAHGPRLEGQRLTA